uniref:Uncharacterized protein n=1 Tax=Vespula pensylvanica TaxID=30213 RepID=A0A834KQR0_VESPE|nr:hypothetical protein H0235_013675 [Vespula pensylvanica]
MPVNIIIGNPIHLDDQNLRYLDLPGSAGIARDSTRTTIIDTNKMQESIVEEATLSVSSLVIEALAPTLVGVPGAGTFSTMMALLAVAVRFYTMPVESLSMCDERDGHMGWVVYVDTGMDTMSTATAIGLLRTFDRPQELSSPLTSHTPDV